MDQQLSRNSSSETQNNVAADTMEPENNNLEGTVKDEYWRYIPLLKAALIRGDWDAASRFFAQDESAITAPITNDSETALHIAVGTGERAIHFVEKLVELMPAEALTRPDCVRNTALHAAANVGNTRASVVLVQKNPDLLYIRGHLGMLPLHCAALYACKDTLLFLLNVTGDDHVSRPFSNKNAVRLVNYAISSGFYGSQKLQTMLWKVCEFLVPLIKHIREQKQMHVEALTLLKCVCEEIRSLHDSNVFKSFAENALIIATRLAIHEVIEEIVDSYPKLIWTMDDDNRTIFQRAVIDHHENVFNLLYQMGDYKRYLMLVRDNHEDTMLHLAGRLAPRRKLDLVPSAALQMQRELQWFKEVEKQVPPMYKEWQNKSGETPAMVFTTAHEKLVEEGQKWMKDTANSCTIAAALIVTVVFAAAITVPGGSDNTGLPIFSKNTAFIAFAVSDAISLFTSTTSLLMFLSILTSRCAESDFLYVLPKRLIIGLSTLFLSITTMMVAFSATLYLSFGHDKLWMLIPVAVLASLPVTSFVSLQFPLLVDLISTAYGPGIFGKRSDRPFY